MNSREPLPHPNVPLYGAAWELVMTHSETVMIRDGSQFRPVRVEMEVDMEVIAQKAMTAITKKIEALDGALKCRVKVL